MVLGQCTYQRDGSLECQRVVHHFDCQRDHSYYKHMRQGQGQFLSSLAWPDYFMFCWEFWRSVTHWLASPLALMCT